MQSPIQAAELRVVIRARNTRLEAATRRIPDTPRDTRELINRRIGANCNNGDLPVTIKADPVGGEDMQRKSGRLRNLYAYVRSLHHIIPSTFFFTSHYDDRYGCQNGISSGTLFPRDRRFDTSFPFHLFWPSGQVET